MAVANKVRVYDLAKELKQDTKRIIEDLRREGADVDVPSNSVPKEIADKVRNKYFPKKEVAPARAIKVIKKAKHVEDETPEAEEPVVEQPEEAPVEEAPIEAAPVPEVEEAAPAKTDKQVRKLKKPVVVEAPEEEAPAAAEEAAEPAPAEVEEVSAPVKTPETKTVKPGTHVKQIRISA